jgi:chitinase
LFTWKKKKAKGCQTSQQQAVNDLRFVTQRHEYNPLTVLFLKKGALTDKCPPFESTSLFRVTRRAI